MIAKGALAGFARNRIKRAFEAGIAVVIGPYRNTLKIRSRCPLQPFSSYQLGGIKVVCMERRRARAGH